MNRKYAPLLILLCLLGCALPRVSIEQPTATPLNIAPTNTPIPPLPTAQFGLAENPVIIALTPASNSPEQINAAKGLAAQFTQQTGHAVVVVIPDSESDLVDSLAKGNAHISLLDPLSYALAYQKGLVKASFAVVKEGKSAYGAQFIASNKLGFVSYFDETTQTNLANAPEALAQFADRKPCWSEDTSPSGYLIPLGYLNKNQIITRPAAFLQGHPTVVRSLYLGGICDFGATYVDARKFPSLEDQYPDLMEQVIIVWRMPEIIPYFVLTFSTTMPEAMRNQFINAVPAIMQTENGKAAFKSVYDIEELISVNDAYYEDFFDYINETHIDLSTLIQ